MTLATHAVIGATVASAFPVSPLFGFLAGFMSHFVLDSIPHWDYHLASSRKDEKNPLNNDLVMGRAFVSDLLKIGCDFALGFALVFAALKFGHLEDYWLSLYAGACGGVLPDFLQFAYMKLRREPLISLQRFHGWIHADLRLNDRPFVGILSQVLVIVMGMALLINF
ncbi:MAG TPA: hypothetical protein VEB60_00520 [Candidatus Paceibacterota bacterium]|nr:hypothetical protein [Candidatus Paceibacterota bacterium]